MTTESNTMIFKTVDKNYILDAINHLKSGKADQYLKGIDHHRKRCKYLITEPLKIIFNDLVINDVFLISENWQERL